MCHALQHSGIILSKEVRAMNGQADEFCLVDPLSRPLDHGDIVHKDGPPETIDSIAFEVAPAPPGAPDTPAPPPAMGPGTPKPLTVSGAGGGVAVVPSVLTDDELWGPPAGARRPYQAIRVGSASAAASSRATPTTTMSSPPWANDHLAYGSDARGGADGTTISGCPISPECASDFDPSGTPSSPLGVVEVEMGLRRGGGMSGIGGEGRATGAAAKVGRPGNGGRVTPTPRRKRTSGINRERQHGGGSAGGLGSGRLGGGGGSGRRRGGPLNGKGGLSKKTLNIVTNLKGHATGVRSRQEIEEVEEEKRLAEEERRFKENLRQKGDDFDHTIRILLLGDSGVGKTSLMTRFSEDKFAPTMISTAGVDFKVQTLDIHGKRVRCQIWDTAGQEKFHVITRAYYRGAHGIALAYDVTDGDSFKNVNYWMANIQTHADPRQRIQKMILGNKVDIKERGISIKDGQDVAKEFGVRFFEVSAKNGYGVSDAFYTLAVDIVHAVEAVNRKGDDERRAGKLFGNGAARLRSLASRKPSFMSGRRTSGMSWPSSISAVTGVGASAGNGTHTTNTPRRDPTASEESRPGSRSASEVGSELTGENGGDRRNREFDGGGGAAMGSTGGGGGSSVSVKLSAERCKVS